MPTRTIRKYMSVKTPSGWIQVDKDGNTYKLGNTPEELKIREEKKRKKNEQ